MNFTKWSKVLPLITIATIGTLWMNESRAEETVKEKAVEAANDAKRGVKKTYRSAKDKTCSMVKGKMECAAESVKHSVQNAGDAVEDATE